MLTPAALPMKAVPTSHHYANTLAAERDLLQQQQNRLSPSSPHQDAIATLTRPLAEGPWQGRKEVIFHSGLDKEYDTMRARVCERETECNQSLMLLPKE